MIPLDYIKCIDCVEGMRELPNASIDCAVFSPPYDNIRDYHGFHLDLHSVGIEMNRILKDGASACMVINDSTKDGAKSLTTYRTIIAWCDNCGFRLFENCIYHKHGAPGAWWNKRFRVDHEYILIFFKGNHLAHFNKEPLKIPAKWAGIAIKGCATRKTDGTTEDRHVVITAEKKCRGTVWDYMGCGDKNHIKSQHPATFPDALAGDLITCFCPSNGIVLDPFMGSGTTAVMAKKLNRHYIGFECSVEYCNVAGERLQKECSIVQEELAI